MEKLWGVWQLEEKIGQGSFGEVYKSSKEELGKTFYSAIKHISLPKSQSEIKDVIHEGYATTTNDVLEYYKDTINELQKEIEIMYELRANKNIVDYQDHIIIEKTKDEVGFDIYIRMELLTSLDSYLEDHKLDENEVLKIGLDIINALVVCNKHNLLHRDIKPANIFIDENGIYKLGDFGVARRLEKTTYGMSKKGTYNYMSPEIYKGGNANISSDIYSLGIVMYRLLNNNRAPFIDKNSVTIKASDSEKALMRRMNGEEIPDLEGINESLMKVIKKACAFNQKNRYNNPIQMKKDLEMIKNGKKIKDEDFLEKTVSIHDNDELEKTVSIHDNDELEKTVSIYNNDELEKTVSVYENKYTTDEELRNRIRKIMQEESSSMIKGEVSYISIKTYIENKNKLLIFISFVLCTLIFICNVYSYKHMGSIINFSHDLIDYNMLKAIYVPIIIIDIVVLISFIISLYSRKSQKISSYGYLFNILLLTIIYGYIYTNNQRVGYIFFAFLLLHVLLYFINYKWKLGVKTIDVAKEEEEEYKKDDKKLEEYYSKPYNNIKRTIIISIILLIICSGIFIINKKPIKSQSNKIDVSKKQIKIVNDFINIRKDNKTQSEKIGIVYKDEIYTVLDEKEGIRNGKEITWYHIKTNYGVSGYIASDSDWIKVISGED